MPPDRRRPSEVLKRAVDKALANLKYARSHHASRRAQVEPEQGQVQRRLDRLIDALADGSLPADEIKARLRTETARKPKLKAELEPLDQTVRIAAVGPAEVNQQIQAHQRRQSAPRSADRSSAADVELLVGKIDLEPVAQGRERGYKFRGALTIEKLLGGKHY